MSTGLLFPGQGAHSPEMFAGVRDKPTFADRYDLICELTKSDVLRDLDRGDREILNQNLFSSLMTVLVSSVSLDLWLEEQGTEPRAVAGYSVGQWSAMYAAGMIEFAPLAALLVERARLMDECVARAPGAMCAVIGLRESVVGETLAELRAQGHAVFIANYNCVGQYSIAGTRSAVELAEARLLALRPKKLVRVPVSGAWHCPLLADAADRFALRLASIGLLPARRPVVDNVTGGWLPTDERELRATLARHLSHPVLWDRGIKTMIAAGVTRFVELGYGSSLSKFGFFIDRNTEFGAFHAGSASCAA